MPREYPRETIPMISCFKGKFKVTSIRGYRTLGGKREYHGGLDVVALGSDKNVYAIADGVVSDTTSVRSSQTAGAYTTATWQREASLSRQGRK